MEDLVSRQPWQTPHIIILINTSLHRIQDTFRNENVSQHTCNRPLSTSGAALPRRIVFCAAEALGAQV